ncbi:MAG: hypothetical protein FWB85_03465 [Chitinispirillia bacterium]|nr:hypothetical protein [Chitinispirillia bacterium]MCL2241462.1 hypothetical protein [Chitinispirillia bacterium]
MEDHKKQGVSTDEFEDGLRDILSYGPADTANRPESGPPPERPEPRDPLTIAGRFRREEEVPPWASLIRPIALLALVGLMLLYIYRVFINN